jgi:hypothetical protein
LPPGYGEKYVDGSVLVTTKSKKARVYSIFPLVVNERIPVTRRVAINPSIKLFEVELNPGISFTDERTYQEIHPNIVGNFSAKQYVRWQFKTSKSIKQIVGTQIIEFIVEQDSNTKSIWQAIPSGKISKEHSRLLEEFKSLFRLSKKALQEAAPEKFTVPVS